MPKETAKAKSEARPTRPPAAGSPMRPYTPSRHHPRDVLEPWKARPQHPEARSGLGARPLPNVLDSRAAKVLELGRAREPAAGKAPSVAGAGSAWLGRPVASGAYGTAYSVVAGPGVLKRLEALSTGMRYPMAWAKPPGGSSVIVKVARAPGGEADDEFVRDNLRETLVHAALAESPCIEVPGAAAVCVGRYVPRPYMAGLVRPGGGEDDAFVTVMSRAPGETVDSLVRRGEATARLYVAVERAACALWMNGYVHGDLHKGNVLFDPAKSAPTIIDFGFAAKLPAEVRDLVRAAVARGLATGVRSMGEIWRDTKRSKLGAGVQRYVNGVMATRKYDWYNPDGNALMRLYDALPVAEKAKVPMLRRVGWGYSGPAVTRFTKVPTRSKSRAPPRRNTPPAAANTPSPPASRPRTRAFTRAAAAKAAAALGPRNAAKKFPRARV